MKRVYGADLFCGAGGSSSGLRDACAELGLPLDLLAINHWDVAIKTHSANHPAARHLCDNLGSVNPHVAVPGKHLDILIASPECTHHSRALGGLPRSNQSRASGWTVLRWAAALKPNAILIENVREYQDWGPLVKRRKIVTVRLPDPYLPFDKWIARTQRYGGTLAEWKKIYKRRSAAAPTKLRLSVWSVDQKRKGETYQAFIAALRSLGYTVDARVLNCANYGDPTTRERLFILAKRGNRKIKFPDPTHTPTGESLFGKTEKWAAARGVIDWNIPGESIFNRKRPLSPNTLRRIEAGLKKFGGLSFVLPLEGYFRGNAPRSLDQPLPTITQRGAGALVQPFILNVRGGDDGYTRASSIDAPLPTVTASSPTALIEPFIVSLRGTNENQLPSTARSIDEPLPTVMGNNNLCLAEPFLVEYHGGEQSHKRVRSVDEPLPTQDTSNRFGLVEPFVIGQQSKAAPRSVDEPLPTVAGKGAIALVEPFITKYYGSGEGTQSVEEPLATVTSKDRFGLVIPELDGAILDIRFRMLQPHELARAMSFPDDYAFAGNREQKVKQIGNAVPRLTAKALCLALLSS